MATDLPSVTLYGISNCDQVKKARAWLTAHAVPVAFHDVKKSGITPELINSWLAQHGWEALLNRRGTTWRSLPDARKAAINNAESAVALMLENASIIRRPILVTGGRVTIGFDETLYQSLFAHSA